MRVEASPRVYLDRAYLDSVSLIIQINTMATITGDEFAGLQRAVLAGVGFAGWHGGVIDAYRDNADYLHMVGGQFAHHAGKRPDERIGDESDNYVSHVVHITELGRTHAITAGINDFELVTEQYWVLSDDYNDVLATTTQAVRAWDAWHRPVTSPAIWVREWGAGRVFVSAPGHKLEVVQDANVRKIIARGLLWAAR